MLVWFYNKYKPAWLLSVIMITSRIFMICENWMFLTVVDFPEYEYDFSDDCPHRPQYQTLEFPVEYPVFYWSQEQKVTVVNIFTIYSPIFSTLFAGIYSDKYGGRNPVLLGLVMSGVVSSVSYLVALRNDYVFLAMLVVRGIGEGMITAAVWSLAGKWSMPHEKSMFVSILFIGQALGKFMGELLARTPITWKTACYLSACMYFINAFWWWLIFQFEYVPKTCKFTVIPWKEIIVSVSLYILTALIISCTIIESLSQEFAMQYVTHILYLEVDVEWIVYFVLFLTKTVTLLLWGAASDYIIIKGLLYPFALRRAILGILFPFLYYALFVVSAARCNLEVALACCVILNFIYATFQSTVYTATLDIASTFSGIFFGIVIWLSKLIDNKMGFFIINISEMHVRPGIKSYNFAFLILTAFATGFSLPFILYGVKKIPWGIIVSERTTDRSGELESTVFKDRSATLKGSPGPSHRPQNQEVK